jgi:hypothetical protein
MLFHSALSGALADDCRCCCCCCCCCCACNPCHSQVGCPVTQRRCGDGSCVKSTTACPCGDASQCSSSIGETCVNGKCRRSRRVDEPDVNTGSCIEGRQPCNGRCILQGGCCTDGENECPAGQVCSRDGGRCVRSQAPDCPAVGLPPCVDAATGESAGWLDHRLLVMHADVHFLEQVDVHTYAECDAATGRLSDASGQMRHTYCLSSTVQALESRRHGNISA